MGFLLAPTNFNFSDFMCLIYDFTIKSNKTEKSHTTFINKENTCSKETKKLKCFAS